LTIAEEVINTTQAFIKEPSFFSALKGCLVLYRQFDSIGIYVNEYFDSNWDKMYGVALADFIIDNISSSCKVKTIHTQDKDVCIKEAIVDGEKVSWATTISGPSRGSSGNVFARIDRLEESKRAIKKLLWQNMKHDFIVCNAITLHVMTITHESGFRKMKTFPRILLNLQTSTSHI
jgi:hypothetical protein